MRIEELIVSKYASLNETDLMIWKQISSNKEASEKMTIDHLAELCNVSHTTITRFVKKLGFKGYSEFKVVLSWEAKDTLSMNDQAYDLACDAIVRYVEDQKEKNYERICRLLYEARQIYAYGSGDIQNAVAKQIKRMFLSCQEMIYDVGGVTFDHAFFQLAHEGDVMILISLSGNGKEALQIARQLKLLGVKLISITEFRDNQLTQIADESLYISATSLSILEAHPAYKTTMLYFILVELLFIKYSIYKKSRMIMEGIECSL